MLLITARTDGPIALAEDPRVEAVRIERLGPEAVGALVAHITDGLSAGRPRGADRPAIGRQPAFRRGAHPVAAAVGPAPRRGGAAGAREPLTRIATPPTLHDSLMARLDRLPAARKLAQTGAAIGREFGLDLVTAVIEQPPAAVATRWPISITPRSSSSGRARQADLLFPARAAAGGRLREPAARAAARPARADRRGDRDAHPGRGAAASGAPALHLSRAESIGGRWISGWRRARRADPVGQRRGDRAHAGVPRLADQPGAGGGARPAGARGERAADAGADGVARLCLV